MGPALKVADRTFWVRGTEAHVGGAGELEELTAERCGAVESDGLYSRYRWLIETEGVLGMFAHRPISTSTREHTRGGGAMRTAAQLVMSCNRIGQPVPRYACFGHFHHPEDSGENYAVRVMFLPGWKLHGSYEHGRGFSVEPVGGRVLVLEKGQMQVLPLGDWTYLPEPDTAWECT
jgi:hypothetical protein